MMRPLRSTVTLAAALLFAASVIAQPAGKPLLPPAPDTFVYSGPGDAATVTRVVPVEGRDFTQALEVNLVGQRGERALIARLPEGVKKGDVLWISFWARNLESKRESGATYFTLRFDRLVNGKYKWPPHLERAVSVGGEWTQTSVPFTMETDASPDQVRLVLNFDHYAQRFEISPITFLNYGSSVKASDLPRSTVQYGGSEADAPWRQAAAERIEKFRKGDLTLRFVGPNGQPIANADVTVRMTRLAFNLGTAVNSSSILDESNPDFARYREILAANYNQIVFENEMKWPRWANPKHNPESTLRALDWLDERGITARGHVMIWPSWGKMPGFMEEMKNDKPALRKAVFDNIARQTRLMKGRFVEWDVSNELYAHHDLLDVLGWEELVKWYRAAEAGAPGVQLFYNDYTMFHLDEAGPDHFFNTVKTLLEKGAPVHGIGEQAHIGGTPAPIPLVIERLDRFATLGLPITITEFDMSTADEDFQASYLRDFMTAVFANPATIGVVQWGFWEGQHWFPTAALWNRDWTIRKHGQTYVDLVNNEWRTDATGRTNSDGAFQTRAFLGDYDVTVSHNGKSETTRVKFAAGTPAQTITLR